MVKKKGKRPGYQKNSDSEFVQERGNHGTVEITLLEIMDMGVDRGRKYLIMTSTKKQTRW